MEEKKKRVFFKKLKNKYRLVVLNDSSFEEKISIKLTPLNLFVLAGSVTILLVVLITSLIAFTPLREYIPGYADVNMRRELINVLLKTDSLENESQLKSNYIQNIYNIINDSIPKENSPKLVADTSRNYKAIKIKPSREDSLLRAEIESKDPYTLSLSENEANKNNISSFLFFTPLNGLISSSFNIREEHYGVDIVSKENEAIKATLDGTVLSAEWTLETGYTIQVQHANNLVSVYKHNSALFKRAGQFVSAGEVIAIIGNSGEQSTGPHLHFELWYDGNPIDPQDYMIF
jgi:murein DD-endopeptidase MepM/ murein hydrolase activator NlpD